MLVKSITYLTPLEDSQDIENDNFDVFVELEDGYQYVVVVATSKNILSLMDKDNVDFSEPGYPFIIVRKLTKEIIAQAIESYAEGNAYWLKFYDLSVEFDTNTLNGLRDKFMERDEFIE